jgi:hypothetical protein
MKAPTTLLFTAEEAAAKYPAFFKQYPIQAESTAIPTVFKDFFEIGKKDLREFFPFDGTGRVRIASYEDSTFAVENALGRSLSAIKWIAEYFGLLNGDSIQNILDNKLASGQKFSRALLSAYKNFKTKMVHIVPDVQRILKRNDLCLELPRLPLDRRYDLETVIQNFYSELAEVKKAKISMVLSVNPYDIANASNGAKFSSCNKIGGMYQSAPICAASSKYMAILMLEDEKQQLLGRCYISFSPDMKSYVFQPVYGYMQEAFKEDANTWLRLVIDKKLGSEGVWKIHTGNISIPMEYLVKDSTATFYVDPTASCMFREDFTEIPSVRVSGCRCLICGEASKNLVCIDCTAKHFKRCSLCPQLCSKSEQYCPSCAAKLKTCTSCGKLFAGNENNTECRDCRMLYTRCILCGDTLSIDTGKSAYCQGVTELIQGSVYAHYSCISSKNKKCRKCGMMTKSPFGNDCCFCAEKESAKYRAKECLEKFSITRRALNRTTQVHNIVMNDRIIMPTYEYAIAA